MDKSIAQQHVRELIVENMDNDLDIYPLILKNSPLDIRMECAIHFKVLEDELGRSPTDDEIIKYIVWDHVPLEIRDQS